MPYLLIGKYLCMTPKIVMKFYLTGAGTDSFTAYRVIKPKNPTAKILIVGDENRLAYKIFTPSSVLTSTI